MHTDDVLKRGWVSSATLRALHILAISELWRVQATLEFVDLDSTTSRSRREWRIFAMPVGSFSGGHGFSEFLHGLNRASA